MPQQPYFPPSNRPVTAAAPAKRSGKKLAILGIGAVLLVGIAVLLYLIMGGNQTELTMDAFVDKYIEAYKFLGDYASFVTQDDQSFRNSTLARVETLSGESNLNTYYGASEVLDVEIQRVRVESILLLFTVYPDANTAASALSSYQDFYQSYGVPMSYNSEGRNTESLSAGSSTYFLRIVRVGKTMLMVSCSESEEIINAVLDIIGY